jgi:hypothetical protein
MHVNVLGLTLCLTIGPIMKLIYTPCKYKIVFWAFLFKDKYNQTHNAKVEGPQVKHILCHAK